MFAGLLKEVHDLWFNFSKATGVRLINRIIQTFYPEDGGLGIEGLDQLQVTLRLDNHCF